MLSVIFWRVRDNKKIEIIAYYRDKRQLTIRQMLHYCGAFF
jgi:hypothetical protein